MPPRRCPDLYPWLWLRPCSVSRRKDKRRAMTLVPLLLALSSSVSNGPKTVGTRLCWLFQLFHTRTKTGRFPSLPDTPTRQAGPISIVVLSVRSCLVLDQLCRDLGSSSCVLRWDTQLVVSSYVACPAAAGHQPVAAHPFLVCKVSAMMMMMMTMMMMISRCSSRGTRPLPCKTSTP